mgnify:CR=1 FL=1
MSDRPLASQALGAISSGPCMGRVRVEREREGGEAAPEQRPMPMVAMQPEASCSALSVEMVYAAPEFMWGENRKRSHEIKELSIST